MIYMALEILVCVFALMLFATLALILCAAVMLAREALRPGARIQATSLTLRQAK